MMSERSTENIDAIRKANDAALRAWPADQSDLDEALALAASGIIETNGSGSIMAGDRPLLTCTRAELAAAVDEEGERREAWSSN